MFQNFDVPTDPSHAKPRMARLRKKMKEVGIDAFLVPRADEHQGEYVPERAERLKWLTGFTGSAGAALILADSAFLFVDGRYTLQARQQVDAELFTIEDLVKAPPAKWLEENADTGMRIGFDPWLHTIAEAERLRKAGKKRGAEMVPLPENPVDAIWDDQPEPPREKIELHPEELAGESAGTKLEKLAAKVAEAGADHCVLTDPSSLAWAFNIRGGDVAHTPLALGFAIVSADGRHRLFLDEAKLTEEAEAYLASLARIEAPERLTAVITELASDSGAIGLDRELAAERLRLVVEEAGGKFVAIQDPASLPRATKNAAEIEGTRKAHLRDGIAMCRFLYWLDTQEPGTLDEIGAAKQLEVLRVEIGEAFQQPLRDISFDTISGAGPNGAIIHYRVNTSTNRKLQAGELYLVDSGGQYRDGTTDITRTVVIGEATEEMRRHYTIVLKGLITISTLRFPAGTRGREIDAFARHAHWQAGLDFAHGTGHGVGSYLSVHEGPQRISRMSAQELLAGMILSNEPGYYKEGAYGIRLENLIVVTEPESVPDGEIDMHGFETLTLAPFDRRLIEVAMLERREREWLDAYHTRVREAVGRHLDGEAKEWLERATAPL